MEPSRTALRFVFAGMLALLALNALVALVATLL
jgi:hypothetical protein